LIGQLVLQGAERHGRPSLRHRRMLRDEVRALGRGLRTQVKRSELGVWKAPADRVDPIDVTSSTHQHFETGQYSARSHRRPQLRH